MEFLLSLDQVCVVFFDQALNGFGYPLDVPLREEVSLDEGKHGLIENC